jgi:hypothetical protein
MDPEQLLHPSRPKQGPSGPDLATAPRDGAACTYTRTLSGRRACLVVVFPFRPWLDRLQFLFIVRPRLLRRDGQRRPRRDGHRPGNRT